MDKVMVELLTKTHHIKRFLNKHYARDIRPFKDVVQDQYGEDSYPDEEYKYHNWRMHDLAYHNILKGNAEDTFWNYTYLHHNLRWYRHGIDQHLSVKDSIRLFDKYMHEDDSDVE
jgi:hypothetical protein